MHHASARNPMGRGPTALASAALIVTLLIGCALEFDESLGRNRDEPDAAVAGDEQANAPDSGPAALDATGDDATMDASHAKEGLSGCKVTPDGGEPPDATFECIGNEVPSLVSLVDGGVVSSRAGQPPGTLLAGHSYSFLYDRVLPLVVGQPVTVDVYGSNLPDICSVGEKLFTMTLDGLLESWKKSYCFTPKKSYAYVVTNVSMQGTLFYNSSSVTGTLCEGCSF